MKKILISCLILVGVLIFTPLLSLPLLSGKHPAYSSTQLSQKAQNLVDESFADLEQEWVDYHTHLLGMGTEQTFVHPKMQSLKNPFQYYRYRVYLKSSGITNLEEANQQYIARLKHLIEGFPKPGKNTLLAFDKFYKKDGQINQQETEFYVSNDYVEQVAEKYRQLFIPAVSIHPYRTDALAELSQWQQKGVKIIKWLPNAMGINPADPQIDDYYERVKSLDMAILTHVGIEVAVDADEHQALGNPLLWRRALDKGVKVIFAHVGSLGECQDTDAKDQPMVDCFDLAIRMLEEPKYQSNLFADISAVVSVNRKSKVLKTLLARKDLHSRLIYGSDYPIPAINAMISPKMLAFNDFLTTEKAKLLSEIYYVNPLLFDFVLKRQLQHPDTGDSFPVSLFYKHPAL